MKASIVIPVRNEGPAFGLTVRYLAELYRWFDAEIIIVDDASDVPVGVPSSFLLHRNRHRQGIARSRNIGAGLASGDVLLFTDGHVFFSENWWDAVERAAEGDAIVGARTQIMTDYGQFANRQTDDPLGSTYLGWQLLLEPEPNVQPIREWPDAAEVDVGYVNAAFLAVRRDLFEQFGGFDSGLVACGSGGDLDLGLKAERSGIRNICLPGATVFHYTSPEAAAARPGRHPMDVPRYEGSFENAVRILGRHFPESAEQMKAGRQCAPR